MVAVGYVWLRQDKTLESTAQVPILAVPPPADPRALLPDLAAYSTAACPWRTAAEHHAIAMAAHRRRMSSGPALETGGLCTSPAVYQILSAAAALGRSDAAHQCYDNPLQAITTEV
jgi:hypothetical protein